MARERKQPQEEQQGGAPEWMVTFSDCMTLLLTFFVLLLSFSSFDEKIFRKSRVFFAGAMHSVDPVIEKEEHSFVPKEQIQQETELSKGSEMPTKESNPDDALRYEVPDSRQFLKKKVFFVSSERVFWGEGSALSVEGKKMLSLMAAFMKNLPSANRVVVSEGIAGGSQEVGESGLERALAVVDYLSSEGGLAKDRFSIAVAGTVAQESSQGSRQVTQANSKRILEIVLLERSLYN